MDFKNEIYVKNWVKSTWTTKKSTLEKINSQTYLKSQRPTLLKSQRSTL